MHLYFLSKTETPQPSSIQILGHHWSLTKIEFTPKASIPLPEYTCISYSWGQGRVPNPFNPTHNVSDRTLPALTAAIHHRPSDKFWVDAYCVPIETIPKQRTLNRMGWIYHRAREVVTVFTPRAYEALRQIRTSDQDGKEFNSAVLIDYTALALLEKEDWISRAWTYQEIVNSQHPFFTCEGDQTTIVKGTHFLNSVGYSLNHLQKTRPDQWENLIRLKQFEDLIADWFVMDYQQRSAIQVLANMENRTQTFEEDHFWAMMSVLGSGREMGGEVEMTDPCEMFMALCESMGDYSFIYSMARRDARPDRCWRPVAGPLSPILTSHIDGEGQPGHFEEGSFFLDDMVVLEVLPTPEECLTFLDENLPSHSVFREDGIALSESMYRTLTTLGFTGAKQFLPTLSGCFFPAGEVKCEGDIRILVATKVRYNWGAPGLAQIGNGVYVPGVFVGVVDGEKACSVRMMAGGLHRKWVPDCRVL